MAGDHPHARGRAAVRADQLAAMSSDVCAYIAVFWGVRVALQGVFDVKEHLTAWWLKAGYFALTLLFAAFTVIYGWAAVGAHG